MRMTFVKEPANTDATAFERREMKVKRLHAFLVLSILVTFSLLAGEPDSQAGSEPAENSGGTGYNSEEWNEVNLLHPQVVSKIRRKLAVHPYESFEMSEFFVGDINRDGSTELVATVTQNCSSDPVQMVVVFRRQQEVYVQAIPTHWGAILRDVRDLDGDGKHELIARGVLAESTSHANCVEWHAIYEWDGNGYVEASGKYREYYTTHYVPLLRKRLNDVQSLAVADLARGSEHTPKWWRKWKERSIADCYMGIDKAKRLVGEQSTAGFDRAELWLKSGDNELKKNAIKVFHEIGDAPSMAALETAAKDENERISQRAIEALTDLGQLNPHEVPMPLP